MSQQVFLSHSSQDKALAGSICQFLESNGISVWIAPRNIRPGEDYATAIVRGIEHAECFLLVLTRHANSSNAVRSEVERAFNKSKLILPLRMELVPLSDSLQFFLGTSQWLDAFDHLKDYRKALLDALTPDIKRPTSGSPGLVADHDADGAKVKSIPQLALDDFTRSSRPPMLRWFWGLFDDKGEG